MKPYGYIDRCGGMEMKKCGKEGIFKIAAVLAGILALTGGGLGVLALFGCGERIAARDLTEGVQAGWESEEEPDEEVLESGEEADAEDGDSWAEGKNSPESQAVMEFAVKLLQESMGQRENILISPASMISALGMTANGARGETLEEMEAVMGSPVQELNGFLGNWREKIRQEEIQSVHLANSIWFRDDGQMELCPEFLRTNADYYDAALYGAPFDDSTVRDINRWVRQETDGMIGEILDEIPPDAVMYLANALAFEQEWQKNYTDTQVKDGTFTGENGEAQAVEMMYSTEYEYLEDQNACGLVKYYSGGEYAFAALLPDEGKALKEYVGNLTGARLAELLENSREVTVHAAIPQFETECGLDMKDTLSKLGMRKAFAPDADFSGMGTYDGWGLYIGRILHKTYIQVDRDGTRAGAASVVESLSGSSAGDDPEEPKTVYLDRPFLYMIFDCGNRMPLFLGMMESVEG